jgi:hypothetical protein
VVSCALAVTTNNNPAPANLSHATTSLNTLRCRALLDTGNRLPRSLIDEKVILSLGLKEQLLPTRMMAQSASKHIINLTGEISLQVTIQTMTGIQPLILNFLVAKNLSNETREALICYNELVAHQIYVPGINGVTLEIDSMELNDSHILNLVNMTPACSTELNFTVI